MKLIKIHLRNSLTEGRLTQLIRIAIESPDQLKEDEIEVILDICNTSKNSYLKQLIIIGTIILACVLIPNM